MKIIKSVKFLGFIRIFAREINAITFWSRVYVKPELVDNQDLITHEAVHVRQYQNYPFSYLFRYIFSKKQRLQFECEAFAVQALYRVTHQKADLQATINAFANDIRNYYHLSGKFSLEYIKAELMKFYRVAKL